MDQAIRNKLRGVVTQCRRLLEDSVSQELQGKFGLYAARKEDVQVDDEARMSHLGNEERAARRDILDHFEHIKARGFKPREALDQLVREVAFTHLNRLCAYKMMEARQVYVGDHKFRESVSRGVDSNGVKFYLAEHPDDERLYNAGNQEIAYRHFLDWLGGLLSEEIGVLFHPSDPANRLYPTKVVIDEVLALINDEALAEIWTQDETIGWVYQYFTPKELRDKARKESQAPRNSYELAFRNQFFTPRYVVEFLTDNTLGRIWYEMRQGKTRLAEQCRYLVRLPDEVFLARSSEEGHPRGPIVTAARLLREGDDTSFPPFDDSDESVQRMIDMAHVVSAYDRYGAEGVTTWNLDDGPKQPDRLPELSTQIILDWLFVTCRADRFGGTGEVYSQPWFIALANEVRRRALAAPNPELKAEERFKLPAFVPYRAKKDPRELRILDPASGSGHFLLYCFDLLLTIYEEAYNDPDLGPALKQDYSTLADLRKAVPGLILSRNLHGIDIDLRATQIAALALWLRCQRAYQEMGLKRDRPRITRSNIVCAEPMPGERGLLEEFLKTLREDKLEALIRRVMQVPADKRIRATAAMADRLCELVRLVWDRMQLAAEAGSLLKIEEELQEAIREGQDEFEEKILPFRVTEYSTDDEAIEHYYRFVPGDVDGDRVSFWDMAERLVIAALQEYAAFAANGHRLQRRLFVEDAVRGFAFVDLCRQRFDVALMNPPFGDASKPAKGLIDKQYPRTKNDLYAAFVEQGLSRLREHGMLGAITSRTGFFLSSFQKWREEVLLGSADPTVFADLGYGVLDTAMVETAAFCLRKGLRRKDLGGDYGRDQSSTTLAPLNALRH